MSARERLALFGAEPSCGSQITDLWPLVSELERAAVLRALDAGVLTTWSGPLWDEFRSHVSRMSGDDFVVPTPNGTTALTLAAMASGLGPGDDVLIPSYAYFAVAAPVISLGATPVFCDLDPQSLNLDVDELERRLTRRTKMLIVPHSWGNPAPMLRIQPWARERGIFLLSDASHAQGARINNEPLGRFSDATCYSFGLGKAVSAGELGALTTSNLEIHERALILGGVRQVPDHLRDAYHNALPLKTRPHSLALALGVSQFERLAERQSRTTLFSRQVESALEELPGIACQRVEPAAERVYHRLVLILSDHMSDRWAPHSLHQILSAEGVPVVQEEYALPLHLWSAIRGRHFLNRRFDITPGQAPILPHVDSVVRRTVAIRPFASPNPDDLANRIGEAFRKAWRAL